MRWCRRRGFISGSTVRCTAFHFGSYRPAMDRRTLLTSAAGLGALTLSGCVPGPAPTYPPQSGLPFEGTGVFPSGVGSGDPTANSVLLWVRVHPERDSGNGVPVRVEVSRTQEMDEVVWAGRALATAGSDHCVTVDAVGLRPGTTYWYRFGIPGHQSPVGRTRTAPWSGAPRMRLAAFSCQRITHGWFTAHADMARLADDPATDLDLVLCLGDYVYDTGYADKVRVPGRDDPIQDATTLEDFRSKYRLYRSDPDLQAMHARYPVVHVFDNHDGLDGPGDPQAAAARRAFFEHLPVRQDQPGRLRRSLRWGDLAEVFVTDQRSFRDATLPGAGPLGTSTFDEPAILDPRRTMLGAEQRELADPRAGRIRRPMEDPGQPTDVLAVAYRGAAPGSATRCGHVSEPDAMGRLRGRTLRRARCARVRRCAQHAGRLR